MANIAPAEKTVQAEVDIEKNRPAENVDGVQDEKYEEDSINANKQGGVKRAEAITQVWSKKTLWLMFVLLYLLSFVDSILNSVQYNLNPYITSSFSQHALLSTIGVVSSVIGGTFNFTLAKVVDVWGRVEGFLLMMVVVVIGLVMKCVAKNVETYAAAHTFFWVGHLGLLYVVSIMIADMTTLKNRMLIITLNGTPTIASTFAGPAIAQLFYEESNFRWAFGAFCIILVGVACPISTLMLINQRKARALGIGPEKAVKRTPFESVKHYFIEFDVIGIILCSAGWVLLLLPFNLAASSKDKWASASIIVLIVMGLVSGAAFVCWEKWFAPKQFFPFKLLKDKTIIGACMLYGVMFISIFSWNGYYGSYLQVVHNQSIRDSGYILNAFSLTSSIISPFVGYLISRTGDFKWTAYSGIPFIVLGTALLIPFRTPTTPVGLLVLCEIFMGVGSGVFATCAQLAVMAAVSHQEVAVVVALWAMFGSIGAAVGFTIAGGIWTNVLPQKIYEHLPLENKNLTETIYASFVIPQEYPMGSAVRTATNLAYADVQRRMVIAGACFIPVLVVFIWMWKSINVKKLEEEEGTQAQGTIF